MKVDGLMLDIGEGRPIQIPDHMRRYTEDTADLADLKLPRLQKLCFIVRQAQRYNPSGFLLIARGQHKAVPERR